MKAALAILYPWQSTFEQLGLKRRWWHRLAVVGFFIALLPVLSYSLIFALDANAPVHYFMPEIQMWTLDTSGDPVQLTMGPAITQDEHDAAVKNHKEGDPPIMPVGAVPLVAPKEASIDTRVPPKTFVEMPNGISAQFEGKSDEEIKTIWHTALNKAVRKQWTLAICITILVTLLFSYLLQLGYRLLLYVIYGSKEHV